MCCEHHGNMSKILEVLPGLLIHINKQDVTTFLVFISTFLLVFWSTRRRPGIPPGPPLIPLIGNIYCLVTRDLTGRLFQLRKVYGDIFGVYIGSELTIFLNGYDVIYEAWVKRGSTFAWRPVSRLNHLTFIHHGFLFHNGQLWKEQRNFMQSSLRKLCFSNNGKYIEEVVSREAYHLVDKLETFRGAFEIGKLFNISSVNIVSTLLFDHRFAFDDKEVHNLLQLVKNSEHEYLVKETLVNCLPFLTKLPVDILRVSTCRKAFRGLFEWSVPFLDSIKNGYDMGAGNHGDTLAEMYFRKIEETLTDDVENTFSKDNLKGCVVDLISAGSGTVAETLKVILIYLIRNPAIQEKLYTEITNVIGKESPMPSDRQKLPYVQAVIHEGIRILFVAPFGLPRSVVTDTEFRGYTFPKNSTILCNIESLMKDNSLWTEPHKFKPERFLNEDRTKFSVPKEFMPFSKGPRSCVGETLARIELFQFLTILVQNLKFLPATDDHFPEVKAKFDVLMFCEPYKMRVVRR